MNKTRRKQIEKLIEKVREIQQEFEDLKCEEEDALSNLPESLQDSEKGEKMQEWIDALDSSYSNLEDSVSELETML